MPPLLLNGEQCDQDDQCASGACYRFGVLGGICGECTSDDDCPDGGCTPADILSDPPQESVCNVGELSGGCESDAACSDELVCATLVNVPGLIPIRTCSECETDIECGPGWHCTPVHQPIVAGGFKYCAPTGSVADGANCELLGTGDQACESGHCAAADLMGLVELGVCSQCELDTDCSDAQICLPPEADLESDSFIPGVCSP